MHRALDPSESVTKSLNSEWTEQQLGYLKVGGNKRFTEFVKQYDIAFDPPLLKYRTKAAEYYRLRVFLLFTQNQLKAVCEGLFFEMAQPAVEEGREVNPMPLK